jgi:hydroxymethylglutaryl-CoA reductase
VVYGRTALAAALDRRVTVEVERRAATAKSTCYIGSPHREARERLSDPRLAQALSRAVDVVGLPRTGWVVTISTDVPLAMGLGSSAALSVALVRTLARFTHRPFDDAAVCSGAFEIEKIFHGFPSGIDNTVATHGGLIAFTRGAAVRPLYALRPLPLVVALGRAPRHTRQTVTALRAQWEANTVACEQRFDEIAVLVSAAEQAIAAGDLVTLGAAMNANHAVLEHLGISTDELEQMVDLARTHGALGAKLTGGGGGGAVVCLCADDRSRLMDAFTRAGWQAFTTDIDATQRGAHADNAGYADHDTDPRA